MIGGLSVRRINKFFVFSILFLGIYIFSFLSIQLDWFDVEKAQVIRVKDGIPSNSVITENNVFVGEISRQYLTDSMATTLDEVVGKRAVHDIDRNMAIVKRDLDAAFLRPTNQHQYYPIPSDWLLTIQGTIRRFDLVNVTPVLDSKAVDNNALIQNEAVLEDVPVAFVKNSKNREVKGLSGSRNRLNGNSNPEELELSLLPADFKKLERLRLEGYKFVLSY